MLTIERHFQTFLNALCLRIGRQHFDPCYTLQHAQGTTAEVDAAGQNEQKLEETFQKKTGWFADYGLGRAIATDITHAR